MPRRARIRVHVSLRGLPGSEHVHVVVEATRGEAGPVVLALVTEDSDPTPWTGEPASQAFHLAQGQRRWASFGVEPGLAAGVWHRFEVRVTAGRLRLRRGFRLEEAGGHWRLRTVRRRLRGETSNVGTA